MSERRLRSVSRSWRRRTPSTLRGSRGGKDAPKAPLEARGSQLGPAFSVLGSGSAWVISECKAPRTGLFLGASRQGAAMRVSPAVDRHEDSQLDGRRPTSADGARVVR